MGWFYGGGEGLSGGDDLGRVGGVLVVLMVGWGGYADSGSHGRRVMVVEVVPVVEPCRCAEGMGPGGGQ